MNALNCRPDFSILALGQRRTPNFADLPKKCAGNKPIPTEAFTMFKSTAFSKIVLATLIAISALLLPTTEVLAQAKEAAGTPGIWDFLLLPIGFMFIMFMVMRPHHKKLREQSDFLHAVKVGDEVITSGGIIGRVRSIADQFVSLEVASGTHMKIAKPFLKGLTKVELANDAKKT
jgi:preprotein translocase subunit YajC